jgi:hypothetical protein
MSVLVSPEAVRAWTRILRDFAIVLVGVFILLHETLVNGTPDPILIGAGLILLGLPPALRFDEWLKGGTDGDSEKK